MVRRRLEEIWINKLDAKLNTKKRNIGSLAGAGDINKMSDNSGEFVLHL